MCTNIDVYVIMKVLYKFKAQIRVLNMPYLIKLTTMLTFSADFERWKTNNYCHRVSYKKTKRACVLALNCC